MDDVFVGSVMSTSLSTVSPDTLVEETAQQMLAAEVGSVLVVEEDELVGILTSTDFVKIVAERKPKDQTPVETYMSPDPITVSARDHVSRAAEVMIEHGIHHLPVVDDGELIGIVTSTDMAAYLADAPRVERQ